MKLLGDETMKKAKKYIGYYCPDCRLNIDGKGINYCVCPDGYWENAKWIKKRGRGEKCIMK